MNSQKDWNQEDRQKVIADAKRLLGEGFAGSKKELFLEAQKVLPAEKIKAQIWSSDITRYSKMLRGEKPYYTYKPHKKGKLRKAYKPRQPRHQEQEPAPVVPVNLANRIMYPANFCPLCGKPTGTK